MLTNTNYKATLQEQDFTLVLVSGGSCAHCTTMFPIVNGLKLKFPTLNVFHVDVNESNNDIVKAYGVEAVPTILFLHQGSLISQVKGYQPEEILEIYIQTKMDEYKAHSKNLN